MPIVPVAWAQWNIKSLYTAFQDCRVFTKGILLEVDLTGGTFDNEIYFRTGQFAVHRRVDRFLGHLNIQLPYSGPVGRALSILWANMTNGPAAVILFFVISGLVIHLPYAGNRRSVDLTEFYARRFIRIVIPAGIVLSLQILLDMPLPGVLWSIFCELIYYALYPALLLSARRFGWGPMVVGTGVIALGLALATPEAHRIGSNSYVSLGVSMTWIIGLPVWLAGAWLAENRSLFTTPNARQINMLRLAVFGTSVVLRIVKFHVPAPWGTNTVWLNLFAVLVVYWLGKEIAWRATRPAPKRLESLGTWSYSLYLLHPVIFHLLAPEEGPQPLGYGVVILAAGLLASWLFYLAVERPSHMLARRAASALRRETPGIAA